MTLNLISTSDLSPLSPIQPLIHLATPLTSRSFHPPTLMTPISQTSHLSNQSPTDLSYVFLFSPSYQLSLEKTTTTTKPIFQVPLLAAWNAGVVCKTQNLWFASCCTQISFPHSVLLAKGPYSWILSQASNSRFSYLPARPPYSNVFYVIHSTSVTASPR